MHHPSIQKSLASSVISTTYLEMHQPLSGNPLAPIDNPIGTKGLPIWAKGFPDRGCANAFPGSWNYTGCCISPYSFVLINVYNVILFIGTTASDHKTKGIDEKEERIHPVLAIINSCKGERTCLKPAIYDHFKISSTRNASAHPTHEGYVSLIKSTDRMINRHASTGKNDSKKSNLRNGELENPLCKVHGKISFTFDRLFTPIYSHSLERKIFQAFCLLQIFFVWY